MRSGEAINNATASLSKMNLSSRHSSTAVARGLPCRAAHFDELSQCSGEAACVTSQQIHMDSPRRGASRPNGIEHASARLERKGARSLDRDVQDVARSRDNVAVMLGAAQRDLLLDAEARHIELRGGGLPTGGGVPVVVAQNRGRRPRSANSLPGASPHLGRYAAPSMHQHGTSQMRDDTKDGLYAGALQIPTVPTHQDSRHFDPNGSDAGSTNPPVIVSKLPQGSEVVPPPASPPPARRPTRTLPGRLAARSELPVGCRTRSVSESGGLTGELGVGGDLRSAVQHVEEEFATRVDSSNEGCWSMMVGSGSPPPRGVMPPTSTVPSPRRHAENQDGHYMAPSSFLPPAGVSTRESSKTEQCAVHLVRELHAAYERIKVLEEAINEVSSREMELERRFEEESLVAAEQLETRGPSSHEVFILERKLRLEAERRESKLEERTSRLCCFENQAATTELPSTGGGQEEHVLRRKVGRLEAELASQGERLLEERQRCRKTEASAYLGESDGQVHAQQLEVKRELEVQLSDQCSQIDEQKSENVSMQRRVDMLEKQLRRFEASALAGTLPHGDGKPSPEQQLRELRKKLTDENMDLQVSLRDLQRRAERHQVQTERLESENSTLRESLIALQGEADTNAAQLRRLNDLIAERQQAIEEATELRSQLKEQQQIAEEQRQEVSELANKLLVNLSTQVYEQNKECHPPWLGPALRRAEAAEHRVEILQADVAALRVQSKEANRLLITRAEDIRRLQAQLNDALAENEKFQQALEVAKANAEEEKRKTSEEHKTEMERTRMEATSKMKEFEVALRSRDDELQVFFRLRNAFITAGTSTADGGVSGGGGAGSGESISGAEGIAAHPTSLSPWVCGPASSGIVPGTAAPKSASLSCVPRTDEALAVGS
eukprot:TRINITY_DN24955_c0_g1_i2.p1 TRINITY_DN24955_c0_g1~~TRINITY_DN24955_c0_g1_i2.p1  ORF type:complete len:896 (+),score=173.31 TRINITY_DN24955_c0_g1_i2:198-2885(+)